MRTHPVPAIATRILKLFCPRAEDESLIGDLLEKYQGRGRFWYWRQVSGIVFVRLGRNIKQFSLSAMSAVPMRSMFTVLLAIAVLAAVLLSDIWMICLLGILGGVVAGALIFLFNKRADEDRKFGARIRADQPVSNHPGISIHHIPVEGAVGLLFVLGTMLIFGAGVPAIREIFVLIAPVGALASGILLYWHKRHSVKIEALDLHKK
jgi:hypothetical protein